MLLLGFILPIAIPSRGGDIEFSFINLQMLGEGRMPFFLRLYFIIPLISGILGIVALNQQKSVRRAMFWAIAGFLPTFVSLIATGDAMGMMGRMGGMGGMQMLSSEAISFFMGLGFILLMAGAYSGEVRRGHHVPAIMAGIGGGLMLLGFIIPNGGMGMRGGGSVLLAMPFQLLEASPISALILIGIMALIIAACVVALVWAFKHKEGVNNSRSILSLMGAALAFGLVALFVSSIVSSGGRMIGLIMITLIFGLVKVLALFGGLIYAKVMFVTELTAYPNDLMDKISGNATAGDDKNSASQSQLPPSTPTPPPVTPPVTPPTTNTDAPSTDAPPAGDPPAADPPATSGEAPITDAPAADPPAADPPATDEPNTTNDNDNPLGNVGAKDDINLDK
ncbi:MAG: hypothetical protein AAF570_00415 [Bacteroidota bacterium]